MQEHPEESRSTGDPYLAFWQKQLRESARKPWLASLLLRHGTENHKRYNQYYERLRALPRKWRRAISRKLSLGMAGAAMLLALSGSAAPPAHAADILVDGVACTLADAIMAANSDTAVGGCAAGAGPDTIHLNTDVLLAGELPAIVSEITLQGNGWTIARDAAALSDFGVLTVNLGGDLTLNDAIISGGSNADVGGGGIAVVEGSAVVYDSLISGNSAVYDVGGGIGVYNGVLSIDNSTISGNTADYNGGGGIGAIGSDVTVTGSTVDGNTAYENGGGINATSGSVTLIQSTISGNSAVQGGGLYAWDNAQLEITGSRISDNTAYRGGGIYVAAYSQATIVDSAVSGNISSGSYSSGAGRGGGIRVHEGELTVRGSTIRGNEAAPTATASGYRSGQGGGISSYNSPVTISNSTISGNSAIGEPAPYVNGGRGGGIMSVYGDVALHGVTISQNLAEESGGGLWKLDGVMTLDRSIISGNNALLGEEIYFIGHAENVFADNYNVFGYDNQVRSFGGSFAPGPNDVIPGPGVFVPDILAPLAENGGPTKTHALVPGSPAVDIVPNGASGLVDQRGSSRDVDGDGLGDLLGTEGDAGAFEFGAYPFPLAGGWNLISFNVTPDDPAVSSVLAGIAGDLVLQKNGAGEVYWPAYGVDQIGVWQTESGYQVYMTGPRTLAVYGSQIDPTLHPIALNAGWNMAAYLRDTPLPVATALAGISSDLYLVKDGDGRVYWPAMGIINDLVELEPGKGYQILMHNSAVLTYPPN